MNQSKVAFVWESFGPSHRDRIDAVEAAENLSAIGVEFSPVSTVYNWEGGSTVAPCVTLFDQAQTGQLRLAFRLTRALLASRARSVFLCHYHLPAVYLTALALRLSGRRVFTMIDSKFDDYPRQLPREALKWLLMRPYHGALAASRRNADYLHTLGFSRRPVVPGFDSLDVTRLRLSGAGAADIPHAERDFLIVARLVSKKNLDFAIRAFAQHRATAVRQRKLRIVGYGELERQLRDLAESLGLGQSVVFEGALDSAAVARAMRQALCLILPSTEEQFGLVVIEALAQGLPVLVSSNAGAVDSLVDNGVNGWVVDPYRPTALVAAMDLLDRDETVWRAASSAASASSERGDVSHFVAGVKALIQPG